METYHSGFSDSSPSLTIISADVFDKVVIYNRADGNKCTDRIEGATITYTINGQSSSTVFPQSDNSVYTFVVVSSTGALELAHAPTYASTLAPTADTTVAPTIGNQVVINNLQLSRRPESSGGW